MIDFRYHLVSLVSVFLALAVGIVLGAGPLKGELGVQLNKDVQNLRVQLSEQNDQISTMRRAVDNRDAFTRTVLPDLVARQLQGERVVLVTVPGVDTDVVAPLTEALKDAGATVAGRVDLTSAWLDPAKESDRTALVRTLQAQVPPPSPSPPSSSSAPAASGTAGAGPAAAGTASGTAAGSGRGVTGAAVVPGRPRSAGAVPAAVVPVARATTTPPPTPSVSGATPTTSTLAPLLAAALLTRDVVFSGTVDKGATAVLDAFDRAGMIGIEGDLGGHADQAVLLVPAVDAAAKGAPASPTTRVDSVAQWSTVAVALDTAGHGAVVTGPASSGTAGGIVAGIRGQDALTSAVSTIDTGGTPMGDLATVLALREQALGGSGRYGFVGSVDAPLPRSATGRS